MTKDDVKDDSRITLKWGTLKSWHLTGNNKAIKLLKQYEKIGMSYSAMGQQDTPEQKKIICDLIDLMPGQIFLEWDEKLVSHDDAKKYVLEYRKDK